MAVKKTGRKLNRCRMCGTYVAVGVKRCPECKSEITNQHAFLYKYQESIWRAIVGVFVGVLFWFGLYLGLPSGRMTREWTAIPIALIPVGCAAFGWILGYLKGIKRTS